MLLRFIFVHKGDEVEDNSNKESSEYDEILEDGDDVKNVENEKSSEDIWSTDFAVSKELFYCFFKIKNNCVDVFKL